MVSLASRRPETFIKALSAWPSEHRNGRKAFTGRLHATSTLLQPTEYRLGAALNELTVISLQPLWQPGVNTDIKRNAHKHIHLKTKLPCSVNMEAPCHCWNTAGHIGTAKLIPGLFRLGFFSYREIICVAVLSLWSVVLFLCLAW